MKAFHLHHPGYWLPLGQNLSQISRPQHIPICEFFIFSNCKQFSNCELLTSQNCGWKKSKNQFVTSWYFPLWHIYLNIFKLCGIAYLCPLNIFILWEFSYLQLLDFFQIVRNFLFVTTWYFQIVWNSNSTSGNGGLSSQALPPKDFAFKCPHWDPCFHHHHNRHSPPHYQNVLWNPPHHPPHHHHFDLNLSVVAARSLVEWE